MLGRFFGRLAGGNWRPPEQELRFASAAGFDTVQIRSDRAGEIEDELGVSPDALGELFDDAGLEPVVEGRREKVLRVVRDAFGVPEPVPIPPP